MSKWLLKIVTFCSALVLAAPLAAKTLRVPQEYDSIQKAIDISDKGDSISVAPGIYYENIILRDGRSLLGAGADKTIITDDEEGPPDPIVQIDGDCILSGFTITGARGAGIGHAVMVVRGAPRIVDNVVRDNSYTGIGIHSVSQLTDPLVSRNRIYGNGGAGVASLGEFARPIIRNNDVYNNTNVGIVCTELAAPLIENNRIFENGVGIVSKEEAMATIKENSVTRNKMVGLVILKKGRAVISNNKIHENGTVGINLEGAAEAWIVANEISNNATEGVSIKGKSKAYMAFNSVVSNGSIAVAVRNSQLTAVRNQIDTSENPWESGCKDFLEGQGIDVGNQVSGIGPGVIDLKNSSLAVGGNRLGGRVEADTSSVVVKIPLEKLPSSPEEITLPQYRKPVSARGLTPSQEGTSPESLRPLPDLKLPDIPKPQPFFPGCLGLF